VLVAVQADRGGRVTDILKTYWGGQGPNPTMLGLATVATGDLPGRQDGKRMEESVH
jgi:hypothetical protein